MCITWCKLMRFFVLLAWASGVSAANPTSITVVLDDNYPPYIFRDQAGRLQGILKDTWTLWEARTGVKVNLQGVDWGKAQAQILAGHADVIDTMFETPQRAQLYDFGPAYADIDVAIFFHESISGISGVESLKGFTVGVKDGDACVDVLTQRGLVSFRKYPSYEAVIDAAAVGDVRVFCEDRPPATYLLIRKQLDKQFRSTAPLYTGQFHWAVSKGHAATFKLVEDGFARITDAERQEIEERWMGARIQAGGLHPYVRASAYVLTGIAALIVLLGAWNVSLRRRVQNHTREISLSLAQLTQAKHDTEQTLAQLNATLEAIPDLLFELDMDGRYVDYRASRSELLFVQPVQLIGRSVHDVLPADAAAVVMQALHEAFEKGASNGKQIYLDLPQGKRWFELSVARKPIDAGGGDHFVMLSRDISDRKLAEEALARHGDELEQIVHERSRQLVEARDISEQASRAKSEFLSRMSHELRTPMNAILGFSQLLDLDKETTPRAKTFVAEILRAGKHLLHLINDVLDLEQVESGRLTLVPETIVLSDLGAELISLMQPLADQQQVSLSMGDVGDVGDLAVRADVVRVKQVVLNLLSNAVKYNRIGGQVWLDACALSEQVVRITVRDNGVGIAERYLSQLFQPFNRLGAEAGTIEGTGIGLSLCRRLVELMGADMGVHSVEGEGSTFWFDLPRAVPQALADQGALLAESEGLVSTGLGATGLCLPSHQAVLLYVEDNPANSALMEQIVARHHGVTLMTSPEGHLGLALALAHRPDLILLDIHLPDTDGYALLAQLRREPTTRDTPVIAVTANAMPMDVQRIRDAGFDDYVAKPIQITRMDKIIQSHLGTTLA
ncbi:MAG: transporter substrate-binding domain-containing protein [Aquabacterium sp.]|nr:transporter substrate-binding domain-containing protein [Aquabacterium sp.]